MSSLGQLPSSVLSSDTVDELGCVGGALSSLCSIPCESQALNSVRFSLGRCSSRIVVAVDILPDCELLGEGDIFGLRCGGSFVILTLPAEDTRLRSLPNTLCVDSRCDTYSSDAPPYCDREAPPCPILHASCSVGARWGGRPARLAWLVTLIFEPQSLSVPPYDDCDCRLLMASSIMRFPKAVIGA